MEDICLNCGDPWQPAREMDDLPEEVSQLATCQCCGYHLHEVADAADGARLQGLFNLTQHLEEKRCAVVATIRRKSDVGPARPNHEICRNCGIYLQDTEGQALGYCSFCAPAFVEESEAE